MPQFRLTQKIAKDCKIKVLPEPSNAPHPLDDWFIDVIRANRKKIAIITHAKSTYTFFIPYAESGGAIGVMKFVEIALKKILIELHLGQHLQQIDVLFKEPFLYCKTVDKKILGHMTDFKFCTDVHITHALKYEGGVDWDKMANYINTMPVNFGDYKYIYPAKLFTKILNENYLH